MHQEKNIFEPSGHWEMILSFKEATLVAIGKLEGPINDPSIKRNLISSESGTPDTKNTIIMQSFSKDTSKTPLVVM